VMTPAAFFRGAGQRLAHSLIKFAACNTKDTKDTKKNNSSVSFVRLCVNYAAMR
jgi:hypothetical protein